MGPVTESFEKAMPRYIDKSFVLHDILPTIDVERQTCNS